MKFGDRVTELVSPRVKVSVILRVVSKMAGFENSDVAKISAFHVTVNSSKYKDRDPSIVLPKKSIY